MFSLLSPWFWLCLYFVNVKENEGNMSDDKQECTKFFMPLNNANASSPGRLPSFKPRDLKLLTLQAGNTQLLNNIVRPRRTVAPNLNVQRMKDKSENEVKPNVDVKRNNNFKDRKRDDKKGLGRNKGNHIIQSAGIFAEGYGSDIKKRWESKSGSVYDRHSSGERGESRVDKPKLKLENNFLCDKAEEDEDLKYLLRDDFLDDPTLKSNDADGPVTLPLKKPVNVKIEKDIKNLKTDCTPNNTNDIRTVLFDTHLLEKLQDGKVKIKQEPADPDEPFSAHNHIENHVAELPGKPKLIFFEFPDVLPILEYESSDDPSKSSNAKKISASSQDNEEQNEKNKRTLADISEGQLGTMQILKSGKIRLMIGNCPMHVELGTDIHFRQDLLTVNLNECDRTGTLINLGTINNTFVCSPNLQEIIKKSEKSLAS